jgi:exonuclease I
LNQEKQELYDERDKNAPAESKLYSGFIGRHDEQVSSNFRKAPPNEMLKIASQFQDPRLREMASRYVALYHPDVLTQPRAFGIRKTYKRPIL